MLSDGSCLLVVRCRSRAQWVELWKRCWGDLLLWSVGNGYRKWVDFSLDSCPYLAKTIGAVSVLMTEALWCVSKSIGSDCSSGSYGCGMNIAIGSMPDAGSGGEVVEQAELEFALVLH